MSVTTITVTAVEVDPEVGPCGCFACDDWSDCDYCGRCTPTVAQEPAESADDAQWERDNAGSLADWLYGDPTNVKEKDA